MTKRFVLGFVAIACLGILAVADEAYPATIAFRMTGVVTAVEDPQGRLDGWLDVGSSFTSTAHYQDNLYDFTPSPAIGHYHHEVAFDFIGMTLDVGLLDLENDPSRRAELDIHDNNVNQDRLWLSIAEPMSNGPSIYQIDVWLRDPSMTAFDSDRPPVFLDLSNFSSRIIDLELPDDAGLVQLNVETLVMIPEPSTGLLLVGGLLGLASSRSKT